MVVCPDRSVRNKYKLHSVQVHSDGVHGGHYYAYIRPDECCCCCCCCCIN